MLDSFQQYKSTCSYKQLLRLNIEFLLGKAVSPLYGFAEQHLDYETLSFVKELVECNELGLLTTDSQQGVLDTSPLDKELYQEMYEILKKDHSLEDGGLNATGHAKLIELYKQQGGQFSDHVVLSQRAYLVGLIPLDLVYWMVEQINLQNDLIAYSVPCVIDSVVAGGHVPVTYEERDLECFHNFNHEMLGKTLHLRPVTCLDSSNQLERFKFCLNENFYHQLAMDLATLYVIDTRHGRPAEEYLLKVVIALLKIRNKD